MKNSIQLKSCSFLLGLVLIITSCGSGATDTANTDDDVMDDASMAFIAYSKESLIFSLSYLSNINDGRYGTIADLQLEAFAGVNNVLANDTVIQLIGTWTPVWGPITYTANTDEGSYSVSDNTMMLLQGIDPETSSDTMYVLAIAGTISSSAFDWFDEDFDLTSMAAWPQAVTGSSNVGAFGSPSISSDPTVVSGGNYISSGLNDGLNVLFNIMKDDNGVSILDFMQQIFTGSQSPIEIAVAGHSLGGALSPCVALALKDNQSYWNSTNNCKVTCYATAGFTPGNDNFVQYFDQQLGSSFEGSSNSLDIATNLYQNTTIGNVSNLYNGVLGDCAPLQDQQFIASMLNCFSAQLSPFNYTSVYRSSDAFTSSVPITCGSIDLLFQGALDAYNSPNPSIFIGLFQNAADSLGLVPTDTLFANTACFGAMAVQEHVDAYTNHFGINIFTEKYKMQLAPDVSEPFEVELEFVYGLGNNALLQNCLSPNSN